MTEGIHSFTEQNPVMRLDVKNKQERDHAHCTECQNVGCGCSTLSILDLLCVFIVILILDLVLWVCLLLRSHHNNTGCRVISFSIVPNIVPDPAECLSGIEQGTGKKYVNSESMIIQNVTLKSQKISL